MAKSTDVLRELAAIDSGFSKPASVLPPGIRPLHEHVEPKVAKAVSISSDLGTLRETVVALLSDVSYVQIRLEKLLESLKE